MDYPSFNTLHLDHLPSCLGAVHDTENDALKAAQSHSAQSSA